MSGGYDARASQERADSRLARSVARRHGVFSLAEALRFGATGDVVRRRVEAGRWERIYKGVYKLSGVPASWRQWLFAACLAAGTGAGASHPSAARLWNLVGFEAASLELTVPRGRRPRLSGVTVHQLALAAVDLTVVDAIPVTTPVRTLLDLAAVVQADALEEALDDALRRGLVTVRRLRWRLEELGRRPGVATMRRLIEARTGVVGIPESVPETRMARLIERSGLPAPARQHEIREHGRLVARTDFAWPEQRLIIEVESRRWHSSRIRWQQDLARRNRLTRLGWCVVHVTSDDLEHRLDETAAMMSETLARRPSIRD